MTSEVPIASLGVLAIIAKELAPSTETLSSTAEVVMAGTTVAGSSGCFFIFLTLSSFLSLESLSREASCLEGKSIVSFLSRIWQQSYETLDHNYPTERSFRELRYWSHYYLAS
jgi:hypothetical protein